MMKHEFEAKLNELEPIQRTVSDDDYKLIEYVYTFHPCISETDGKRQVAFLYHEFGIRIFRDMLKTANKNKELIVEIGRARHKLQDLLDEADELRKGTSADYHPGTEDCYICQETGGACPWSCFEDQASCNCYKNVDDLPELKNSKVLIGRCVHSYEDAELRSTKLWAERCREVTKP